MAYLITCCKTKTTPIAPQATRGDLKNLSFDHLLRKSREILISSLASNLNWELTLPAWQLYKGKIYSPIQSVNWIKPNTEFKILSALFGFIKHTDKIPMYSLRMDERLVINGIIMPVWKFWCRQGVLSSCIKQVVDIDLLSNNYRKAINCNNDGESVAIEPPIIFTDYGTQKGNWLNDQLDLI